MTKNKDNSGTNEFNNQLLGPTLLNSAYAKLKNLFDTLLAIGISEDDDYGHHHRSVQICYVGTDIESDISEAIKYFSDELFADKIRNRMKKGERITTAEAVSLALYDALKDNMKTRNIKGEPRNIRMDNGVLEWLEFDETSDF
jgi:hypothetical protein